MAILAWDLRDDLVAIDAGLPQDRPWNPGRPACSRGRTNPIVEAIAIVRQGAGSMRITWAMLVLVGLAGCTQYQPVAWNGHGSWAEARPDTAYTVKGI